MSVVAIALRELMALGVTGDALVAAIERIEQAAVEERAASLREAIDLATVRADRELADRKAKAAERTRKWREKVTPEASPSVTVTSRDVSERHPTCERAQVVIPSSSLRSEELPPEKPSVSTPKGARKGSRLPDDWRPDREGMLYAAGLLGPNIDPERELDRFRDYWRAVPGAKGLKLDWPATWRNWCRNAADKLPRKAHDRTHPDRRKDEYLQRLGDIDAAMAAAFEQP